MTDKSFQNHAGTADKRRKVMEEALEKAVDAEVFVNLEFSSELDYDGVDASVYTPEGLKTVALKSRSSVKRNLEYIDLGLRDKGRNGEKSKEAQNFISPRGTIADLLVFSLFDGDEPVEVMVIDFEKLKRDYFQGEVDIAGPFEHKYEDDDGRSLFLDADDIRSSDSLIHHEKKW